MRFSKIVLLLTLIFTSISFVVAQTGDGIPDNCESIPDYSHQFVRYEANNRRLVLVDWNTGNEINTIASDLDNTIILAWSISCQYIAGAVGTTESMDTVVWNVQTGERVGSVPDARYQAHHITWGPDDYLVVETRNGAILWHVPSYQQMTLTTHYDPVTVRNFSRLRWDSANSQLIANLSGSGRVVYDLNTGQEVAVVAERTDPFPGEPESQVIVGSAPYDCNGSYRYGYRNWYASQSNAPAQLALRYDVNTRQVYVDLYNNGLPNEVLVILENDFTPSFFQVRGWSSDCRYAVASVGHIGEDASDTYVWDVTTGQRVGILEDARNILHPLSWHPTQAAILAETRNGAVLWYFPTATQSLLDTGSETALAGYSDIHNFYHISWTENSLFLIPIQNPDIVQVYNIYTGILIETFPYDGGRLPSMQSSNTSSTPQLNVQTPVSTTPVTGETGYSSRGYNCNGLYYNGQISEDPRLFEYSIYDGSTYLFSLQARALRWSPDCLWLYGEVPYLSPDPNYDNAPIDDTYRERLSDYLVFWNAQTGERIQSFYHPYRFQTYSNVSWSSDSSRAVVRTTEGAYLYDLTRNTAQLLVFNSPNDALRSEARIYWDFERGFFLIEGWRAIYGFEIATGALIYEFTSNPTTSIQCEYWGCSIRIIENQYLVVGSSGTIGIWNLDTLSSYFISTRTESLSWWRIRYTRFHMSPSGHYLISVRRDGSIAVWDLQNLNENVNERVPYFVGLENMGQGFESIRFIDDVTVEITQIDGTNYQVSIAPPE